MTCMLERLNFLHPNQITSPHTSNDFYFQFQVSGIQWQVHMGQLSVSLAEVSFPFKRSLAKCQDWRFRQAMVVVGKQGLWQVALQMNLKP